MEKPVTATIAEAAALVRLVAESGVKTLVGHHRRYLAAVQDAKAVIESGQIGRLVAASVLWATRKPDDYFQTAWRTQPGGGPLLINAIHEIDMLRHLCGEIAAVGGINSACDARLCRGGQRRRALPLRQWRAGHLDLDRCGFLALDHRTGQPGKSALPLCGPERLSADRDRRQPGASGAEALARRRRRARTNGTSRSPATALPERYHDPYKAQLAHFQRLIRLNEAPVVSVLDGARTLAATLAIAQASETERLCAPERFTE